MKEKLLNVLACPKCFARLEYDEKEQKLICHHDHLAYSIINNIPVLLENKAILISSPDVVSQSDIKVNT